jgi:ribosomal protein L44E
MKIMETIMAYCPKDNKHTPHKLKLVKKAKASPFAWGERQHARKLYGYVGKVAGKKPVLKRGKHQKVVLECTVCHRKTERIIGTRTEKILELVKPEMKKEKKKKGDGK